MSKKVVIVGGSAGGATTASRLRKLDSDAEIIIYEKGPYISYSSCALPYYIGNIVEDRRKIFVRTPEEMKKAHNVTVKVNSEVASIDPINRTITVKEDDKTYKENYDYLVLSPGAKPFVPPIPGVNSSKIFTLRNVPDADKIKEYLNNSSVKSVTIVGGGYIGVEVAENLKNLGIRVTMVEASPHILSPFDTDMAELIESELIDNGINLITSDPVKSFSDIDNIIELSLGSGTKIQSDMIVLSIGIKPDIDFLNGSAIELGQRGHITVNQRMQTNFENIYALGDAVETEDYVNGYKTNIALASPAARQSDIIAHNIMNIDSFYRGSLGSALIKVFDLTCGSTGNNEKTLQKYNIPYKVAYATAKSHAATYPGSGSIKIKLIFDYDGKILGVQALGYEGVDKRIDVFATLISLGGTVYDAANLQLAYAPAYSTPTDAVNIAGLKAVNMLSNNK